MNCLMMKRVVGEVGVQVTAPTGWRIHFALTRQLSEFHKTRDKAFALAVVKTFYVYTHLALFSTLAFATTSLFYVLPCTHTNQLLRRWDHASLPRY
jgi:hypothetical protein